MRVVEQAPLHATDTTTAARSPRCEPAAERFVRFAPSRPHPRGPRSSSCQPRTAASRNHGQDSRLRVPKTAELVADQLRRQIVRGELARGRVAPVRGHAHRAVRDLPADVARGVPGARDRAADHRAARRPWWRQRARAERQRWSPATPGSTSSTTARRSPTCSRRASRSRAPPPRLAARRRTDDDIELLRAAIAECEQLAADRRRLVLQFSEFHALVVAAARQPHDHPAARRAPRDHRHGQAAPLRQRGRPEPCARPRRHVAP